ncbi:MAG: flavodoxin domain-containing protein [Eubacteriales bacterium]
MKTLIVYGSKYGYTASCAEELRNQMSGDVTVADAKQKIKNVAEYDNVIMGGSIYMTMPNKHVKAFAKKNMKVLMDKKVGLFLCCGGIEKFDEFLAKTFPAELIEKAYAKECFGGKMNKENMSGFHKKIVEMIEKDESQPPMKSLEENIGKLAEKFS